MPKTNLSLMLRPPSGEDEGDLQERLIQNVPVSLAREIVNDFVRRLQDSSIGRYNLYRIEEPQGGRLLPLDFGEIAGILYQRN